jgi:hypothetical protein
MTTTTALLLLLSATSVDAFAPGNGGGLSSRAAISFTQFATMEKVCYYYIVLPYLFLVLTGGRVDIF